MTTVSRCWDAAARQIELLGPCVVSTRHLNRDQPWPQTNCSVKVAAGKPAVAFVRLDVPE